MAKTLASLREGRNMSQRELAKALGLAQSTIAQYETGERMPDLPRVRQIAKFFGVAVEEIFFAREAHDMRARQEDSPTTLAPSTP